MLLLRGHRSEERPTSFKRGEIQAGTSAIPR
jgi:hypothetical protein